MSSHANVLGLVFAILFLAGCQTGPIVKTNHVDGELRGMLYDLDRQPLADASVTVTVGDKPITVVTDLHGRFGLGTILFGPVTLSIIKAGYEPLKWEFRFIEGSQVLYLQMASTDQLFEKAALSLEKKEWQVFQGYLDRAKALAPKSLQGYILGATALEQQGRIDEAIILLGDFVLQQPVLAVELLLGDLYQEKGDNKSAVVHWQIALGIKEDSLVRAKIEKYKQP